MRKSLRRLFMTVVIVGFVGSPALAQADPIDPGVPMPPPVIPVLEVPSVPQSEQPPVVSAPIPEAPPVQVPVAPPPMVVSPPVPAELPSVQVPPPVVQQPEEVAPVQPSVVPVPPVVSAQVPQQVSPPQEVEPLAPAPQPLPQPQVVAPPAPDAPVSEDPPQQAPADVPVQLPANPDQGSQQPQVPADQPPAESEPFGLVPVTGEQSTEQAPQSDQQQRDQRESKGEDGSKSSEQGTVTTNPNKDAPATDVSDVTVVEAPKPAEALPVPEEVLAMTPEVVKVAAIDDEDDKRFGPPLPKPGQDQVSHHDDADETPPANPNIVINGDNNTVNFINIVDSKVGDINQDVSDDDRYIVLRNIDWPGHDLRFPVRPNHPIQLPPNWCGGQSGAWAFAGVGVGPSGAYANFDAGVFHSNGNCGYNSRPPRPQHWPAHLVICPPVGYYGHPQRFDRYTFINETTVFVNNTFVQGRLDNQVVQGAPQQVFVPNGFSRDIVYQQPTQVPPAWLEFETGLPPVASAPSALDGYLVAGKKHAPLIAIGGLLLLAAVAVVFRRLRA
ncbi:MAG: hypothetical protein WAW80_05385 [Candidatus Saccharimonadales bacterium]